MAGLVMAVSGLSGLAVSGRSSRLGGAAAERLAAAPRPQLASPRAHQAQLRVLRLTRDCAWKSGTGACGSASQRRCAGPRSLTVMRGDGKFIVGGNWKCNGTRDSIRALVAQLNAAPPVANMEVVVAPPFLYLEQVLGSLHPRYGVCAQNAWVGGPGAFTGEISAEQLADLGLAWVILGHSERRALCGESNETVGKKCAHALAVGLSVILCVGETLAQREANVTLNVITDQLAAVKANVKDWSKVVIAYEPVWAIGTGRVATPDQAQEVHSGIRAWLSAQVSPEVARHMRIQYGGSVNAGNAVEIATREDVDGFLVGGASLNGVDFVTICNAADAHYKSRV